MAIKPAELFWRNGSVRKEIIIVLLAWFCVYVLFDVFSTFWLISNTIIGIAGELNPLGHALFSLGVFGAYLGKLVGFIALSTTAIFVDTRYGRIKWVREVTETTMLVMVCISLLVALNNYASILATYIPRI